MKLLNFWLFTLSFTLMTLGVHAQNTDLGTNIIQHEEGFEYKIDAQFETDAYERIFPAALALLEREEFRKFFKEIFGKALEPSAELVKKYGKGIKHLSEPQLIRLFQTNEALLEKSIQFLIEAGVLKEEALRDNEVAKTPNGRTYESVPRYIPEEEREEVNPETIKKLRKEFNKEWRAAAQKLINNPQELAFLKSLNDPSNPIPLIFKKNGNAQRPPSYKVIDTFSSHPRLSLIDEHVSVRKLVEYIESIQSGDTIHLNAKEMQLKKVQAAVRTAKSRGVNVHVYHVMGARKNLKNFDESITYPLADKEITSEEMVKIDMPKRLIPADDMAKVYTDLIEMAKYEYMLNVYEVDIMKLKDAIVQGYEAGKVGYIGHDKHAMEKKEKRMNLLKAVASEIGGTFTEEGVFGKNGELVIRMVDSVNLNHQKLFVADWSYPIKAFVAFLSGNGTYSGVHPEGDLYGIKIKNDGERKLSHPNANHGYLLKSWPLAQRVAHELSKTILLGLRGTSGPKKFWLGGSYFVPGVKKSYKGKVHHTFLEGSFSPGGAAGDINTHFIASHLQEAEKLIEMLQFAASSKAIADAIYRHAEKEIAAGRDFEFPVIVDEAAAMTDWSIFLEIAGYAKITKKEAKALKKEFKEKLENLEPTKENVEKVIDFISKVNKIAENPNNRWIKLLTPEQMKKLRAGIKVAPGYHKPIYIEDVNGKKVQVSAKIHHKVLILEKGIITGSFNFSDGALKNQEQIVYIEDPEILDHMRSISRYLHEISGEGDTLEFRIQATNARMREEMLKKLRTTVNKKLKPVMKSLKDEIKKKKKEQKTAKKEEGQKAVDKIEKEITAIEQQMKEIEEGTLGKIKQALADQESLQEIKPNKEGKAKEAKSPQSKNSSQNTPSKKGLRVIGGRCVDLLAS